MKLELTDQQIQIIGAALGAQPYDRVAPLIAELQRQINEQQNPAEVAPVDGPVRRRSARN